MNVFRSLLADAERTLRTTLLGRPWWAGPRLVLVFAPLAGLGIGSFEAAQPGRSALMIYAAIKLPLLILGAAAIGLPGFFVMHAALRARREFPASVRGILAGQAMFAIVLASAAPLLPVWYSVADSHRLAVLGNGAMFAMASACSAIAIVRVQRAVIGRRAVSRALAAGWLAMYAFVGLQGGWMLRPFIGAPDAPPRFIREDPFTNGYVAVLRLLKSD